MRNGSSALACLRFYGACRTEWSESFRHRFRVEVCGSNPIRPSVRRSGVQAGKGKRGEESACASCLSF